MIPTPLRILLIAAGALVWPAAEAAVLRVAYEDITQTLRVFDGDTYSLAEVDASSTSVQVGTVTADVPGHRVYFIGNSAGAQTLYPLRYIGSSKEVPLPIPAALRISHLEWDASGVPRLIGVASDPSDDSVRLITIVGTSISDLGMPIADCCVFRAGVSAFRANDDSLFLVGRRTTDSADHIFRFTMNPLALAQAVSIPADLSVNELAVNAGGQLLGLAYSTPSAATLVFSSDAGLNITTLGGGMADCCFVLAGSIAIDPVNNAIVSLGPGIAGMQPNSPQLWSFDLGTGAILPGMAAISGAGLFFDGGTIAGDTQLFQDGFE